MNVMEQALRERIDPALTTEALSRIGSRALGREVRAGSARVLTGGCWNRVVAVAFQGEPAELVFKISAKRAAPEIEREAAVLRYFTEHTRMPVPRPYLFDGTGETIPGALLVMERMRGAVLHSAWPVLGAGERASIVEQIARHVTELHATRSAGFGGVELAPGQRHARWPEFWIPRFTVVLEEARTEGHLPRETLERAAAVARRFDSLLDVGAESTLTHYDIWSGNVMVERGPRGPRVTGYLDVPGIWADPAREVSFMDMFGLAGPMFTMTYAATHGAKLGGSFELRTAAYNLKMHMKHVSMYPDERYYRDGVLACLARLEQAHA